MNKYTLNEMLRPIYREFASVDRECAEQGIATPESVQDAWSLFVRIHEHAQRMIEKEP